MLFSTTKASRCGVTKKAGAGFQRNLKKYWQVYLMLIPALTYFIIFHYLPIYGIQIAFRDFSPVKGIWGSPWAGFKYFERFFKSPYFSILLKNTLAISIYQLIAGFFPPLILALLLNHQRSERFKKFVQTASYAPHFISVVVMVGMMKVMFSPSMGIVNYAIQAFGGEAVHFFAKPEAFRHLYVWSGIWQDLGWSAIIYVGALSGISPELYEAATIDGASIWKKIWYVRYSRDSSDHCDHPHPEFGSILSVRLRKGISDAEHAERRHFRGNFDLCVQTGSDLGTIQLFRGCWSVQFGDQLCFSPDRQYNFFKAF